MAEGMAEVKTLSKQPRFADKDGAEQVWRLIVSSWERSDELPPWGSDRRPEWLRKFVRSEPILAGATSSMCSKAVALDWQVTGGRRLAREAQDLLANGETIFATAGGGMRVGDGNGWDFLLDRWLQDYYATDLGGVLELAREGEAGRVAGLYNLDSASLRLTGNIQYPLRYYPTVGKSDSVPLRQMDFTRIVDLPSAEETRYGLGLCAVSRALNASKVLMALYRYDEERLADMPMPGIMAVNGITMEQVQEAFRLYRATRENKQQVVFKDLLWLAAQGSTLQQIGVNFTSFASLPEGFNREEVITLYVYTLALAFGVDPREFWPVSQGPLGSGKEAEVQAQKARGKGFGRMVSAVERAINWDVLPSGLEFKFDLMDSEDDLLRANIQATEIANIRKLWEPTMAGPGIIETEEARRLLVERGVLPDWAAPEEEEITVHGSADVDKETRRQGNKETGEEDWTVYLGAVVDRKVRGMVEKARLGPGEDLVAVSKNGDLVTLWSPRFISIPAYNWPGVEVPAVLGPLTSK